MPRRDVVVDKRVWERMKKNLLVGVKKSAQVGWFSGSHHSSAEVPMAQLASWLEFGHRNGGMFDGTITPPRPFMRAGFTVYLKNNPEFASLVHANIISVMTGKKTWTKMYSDIAPEMAKALKMVMESWDDPRNGPITISLKGFDNPLIESEELVNSIQWRVRNRGTK